jgi:uncharacterized membrane protein
MAWYWWVVSVVLGLNALVVVVVAVFLAADWFRARRAASEEVAGGKEGAGEQGGFRT